MIVHQNAEHTDYGFYTYLKGCHVIVVNPDLEPNLFLWVLLHEIFHARWHHPDTALFQQSTVSKHDAAANFFAAGAMLPRPLIAGMTREEVYYQFNVPMALVNIRYELARNENL